MNPTTVTSCRSLTPRATTPPEHAETAEHAAASAHGVAQAGGTASPPRVSATGLVLFCLLLLLYPVLETGLSTWETAYLHTIGRPTTTAAMLTSLFWLGLATGRFAIPLLPPRWSAARIILLASAIALLALGLISIPTLAAAGFILGGIAAGPIKPSALAWIARAQHPTASHGRAGHGLGHARQHHPARRDRLHHHRHQRPTTSSPPPATDSYQP